MKTIITLDENMPAKVEVQDGNANRSFYLELQNLANLISNSVVDEFDLQNKAVTVLSSPALPVNTVRYAKQSDGTDLIFIFHEAAQYDVSYHKTTFENIPFPNLVFCLGVRKNRLTKRTVYAYEGRFLRDDTPLYRFPYSNVYGNGEMCYYEDVAIKDIVQLQTFAHNWISQPFNDHLYGSSNKSGKAFRELLETSQNKPFDYSILLSEKKTFQQWAESVLK